MRTYEPAPLKTPLLRRSASWSQGVPVAALILVAVLALPAIYGACVLVWEIDAALSGETAR